MGYAEMPVRTLVGILAQIEAEREEFLTWQGYCPVNSPTFLMYRAEVVKLNEDISELTDVIRAKTDAEEAAAKAEKEAQMSEPAMPEGFKVVAGEAARRAENASRDARCKPSRFAPGSVDSDSLVRWQEYEGRKWRSVEIVSSMYGWSVRASSGLDGFALLAGARNGELDGSMADAIRWAKTWVGDNEYRYAYVRTYMLSPEDEAAIAAS